MPPSHQIYLSLGSNLGDRLAELRAAAGELSASGIRAKRISSVYETEPVEYLDQPGFLNCVVEAETNFSPPALLDAVGAIETKMGRERAIPKGPRSIDLDILLYNSESIATPQLQIPHPRLHLRRFVLAPLAEIAPNLTHSAWRGTVAQLLAAVEDRSEVRRITDTI
jgi:2-amino-4-hydroxy-6-hydroxymethyldihydropteridine diphosphokinase